MFLSQLPVYWFALWPKRQRMEYGRPPSFTSDLFLPQSLTLVFSPYCYQREGVCVRVCVLPVRSCSETLPLQRS